jgi:hypothetical protein
MGSEATSVSGFVDEAAGDEEDEDDEDDDASRPGRATKESEVCSTLHRQGPEGRKRGK